MAKRSWDGAPPATFEQIIAENAQWALYLVSRTGNWLALKLVARQRQPHKGNYYMGYNVKEQRFAQKKDMYQLQKYRPELYRWAEVQLAAFAGAPEPPRETPSPTPAPERAPAAPEPVETPSEADRFSTLTRSLMVTAGFPTTGPIPEDLFNTALDHWHKEHGKLPSVTGVVVDEDSGTFYFDPLR